MKQTPALLTICLLFLLTTQSALAQDAEKAKRAVRAAKRAARTEVTLSTPTLSNVPYGEHERHVLDFWKADSDGPTPLAFVIHGGGWRGGDKDRVNRFADVEKLLAEGISVVAINYRLIKHAEAEGITPPVKAPLRDAARALQFVRSKAADWNLDKRRIGAAGGSVGACSSLWLTFHDDLAEPESEDPVARESTRLWCAAVIGAQTTLDPRQMKKWTPNSRYGGHAFGLGEFKQFLAGRKKILPWIAEYSPYALASGDDPPVYLIYSTPPDIGQDQKDPTHTSNFGEKLQERLHDLQVDCELVYPGAAAVEHETPTAYLIAQLNQTPTE
jgi:acetyl esterase/lipase